MRCFSFQRKKYPIHYCWILFCVCITNILWMCHSSSSSFILKRPSLPCQARVRRMPQVPSHISEHCPFERLRLVDIPSRKQTTYWRTCKFCVTYLLTRLQLKHSHVIFHTHSPNLPASHISAGGHPVICTFIIVIISMLLNFRHDSSSSSSQCSLFLIWVWNVLLDQQDQGGCWVLYQQQSWTRLWMQRVCVRRPASRRGVGSSR